MHCSTGGRKGCGAPAYLKRKGRWGASGWVVQVCFESAAGTLLLTPGFFAFGVFGAQQAGPQQGIALGPSANQARHALKPVFGGVV